MPDTGLVLVQSGVNVDSIFADWANPGNVTADDGNMASVTGDSDNLAATNCGFSIPSDYHIYGVEVEMESTITGGSIGLTIDGSTSFRSLGSTSSGTVTYGSATNNIGIGNTTTLTPADVNASTFGALVSSFTAGSVTIDYIKIKVTYGRAPIYTQASTGATDPTGGWTATGSAARGAGRMVILQIVQDGTGATHAITSATNIENLAGTDDAWTTIGTFDIGSPVVARQTLYIGRTINASAPTATGTNASGNDLYWRFWTFENANIGTTLADVIENTTAGSTTTSIGTSGTVADAAVVTTAADRLALNFEGGSDDNTLDVFTGMTGGTWVLAANYADSAGTDATLAMQYATLASAGTIDGGTDAWADATDGWGVVGFALIGPTAVVSAPGPTLLRRRPAHRFLTMR